MIETIGLGFSYAPGLRALRGVSLRIDSGERIVLLGANGAGKSTLLSLCNGLLRPCSGEIRLFDEPVNHTKAGLRRLRTQVATVLQDAGDQLFGATAVQDVAMGPAEQGMTEAEARAVAMDSLRSVGAGHLVERPIHALSAGEKKRVALAGVLTGEPFLLLLDEPTAGLDAPGEDALLELLSVRAGRGMAICIASHDTSLLHRWATRAIVLHGGAVVYDGDATNLLRNWDGIASNCGLRMPIAAERAQAAKARPQTGEELAGWPSRSESVVRGFLKRAQAAKARPQTGEELAGWPSRSESVVRGFLKRVLT